MLYYDLVIRRFTCLVIEQMVIHRDQESGWKALSNFIGDGWWWLEWRGVMEMVYSKCTLYPWPPITRSQGVGHGDNGIQGRRRFTRLHPLISPFCIAGEEDRTPPQLWLCWGATAWWLVLSTGVWAMPGPGPSPEEWPSPAADRHQFLVHPAHRQAFCNALLNLA